MSKLPHLLLTLLLSTHTLAQGIVVGQPLPSLTVEDRGELSLDTEGEIVYVDWSSDQLDSYRTVHVIQYMAARPSMERQSRALAAALKTANFTADAYRLTNIVNLNDVTFGATRMAISAMEQNKRADPTITLVADERGVGLDRWNLKPRTATVMILDNSGEVIFFHEGSMDDTERTRALEVINTQLAGD